MNTRKKHDEEEMLKILKAFTDTLDHYPTRREIASNTKWPSVFIYGEVFGSLEEALRRIGVTRIGCEKKTLEKTLVALFNEGKPVTVKYVRTHNMTWVYNSAIRLYDTWKGALKECGILDLMAEKRKKELIELTKKKNEELDHLPMVKDFSSSEYKEIRNLFGAISFLLEDAGLKRKLNCALDISKELKVIFEERGYLPPFKVLRSEDWELWKAIKVFYDEDYETAIKDAGFELDIIKNTLDGDSLTIGEITQGIVRLAKKHTLPSLGKIKSNNPRVYKALGNVPGGYARVIPIILLDHPDLKAAPAAPKKPHAKRTKTQVRKDPEAVEFYEKVDAIRREKGVVPNRIAWLKSNGYNELLDDGTGLFHTWARALNAYFVYMNEKALAKAVF